MSELEHKVKSEMLEFDDLDDVRLLYSMFGLKPVGINKHFYMLIILNNLHEYRKKEGLPAFTADQVWAHINKFYNLKLLEEYEPVPKSFPMKNVDFETFMDQLISNNEAFKRINDEVVEENKPLGKKLTRSESEESKISSVDMEDSTVKQTKYARKKSIKVEENSSEEEMATKTLRTRGSRVSNIKKSESPIPTKRRK